MIMKRFSNWVIALACAIVGLIADIGSAIVREVTAAPSMAKVEAEIAQNAAKASAPILRTPEGVFGSGDFAKTFVSLMKALNSRSVGVSPA